VVSLGAVSCTHTTYRHREYELDYVTPLDTCTWRVAPKEGYTTVCI
jgi:hypothetical protein